MADKTARAATRPPASTRLRGGRRLIAGLRITQLDEDVLAIVRPYLTDVSSEGDAAYRLWRRGLEVTLAEVIGVGASLPPEMTEQRLASLVAQRLLLCLPLLRRTGVLALLELEAGPRASEVTPKLPGLVGGVSTDSIDTGAANAIAALGGTDFL